VRVRVRVRVRVKGAGVTIGEKSAGAALVGALGGEAWVGEAGA